ncbi:hypothetical protein ERO13_D07G135000v2 [Gossypium hirsutum]|nr:hypothetical protein ERO13_D07G135000v2 [Gossypium hirsutum]
MKMIRQATNLRHLLRKQVNNRRPVYLSSHPLTSLLYTLTPTTPSSMDPKGIVVFTSVGRSQYGFDIFTVNLNQTPITGSTSEHRLTDGISINYNAQFVNEDQSIVFISERSGCPRIYLTRRGLSKPEQLPSVPDSLFHDRPIIKSHHLYFISAHEQPEKPFQSWSALYSTELHGKRKIIRLSPYGVVDYIPAISKSGTFVAIASYGSRPWEGDFHELKTDIVVFPTSDPKNRLVVCERGGWPTWSGDSTIFFHRQADDGWWSIFRVQFPENPLEFSEFPVLPLRITPPGLHCITPNSATRQRKVFHPVTVLLNPAFHHYNPFVSSNSESLGYHRFRGKSTEGESRVPHLEPVASPIKDLGMLRINGSFPSFSPDGSLLALNPALDENGDIKVVKSDGSERWTLIKGRVAFCNSWSPTEKYVIYSSLGPIFESTKTTVQIARVTFEPSYLNSDLQEIPCDVKILTREDTGNNAFPSCSPDGKSLVFRSGRSGHKNLYILDAVNGEFNDGIRKLTAGPWIDTMPSWSPNGDLIAFSSNMHNPNNVDAFSIYVIKPDGSDLRRIYAAGPKGSSDVDMERINHVCFSPNGEWLVFAANIGGVTAEPVSFPNQFQPYGDLYVMRLDGSGLRRLTWNDAGVELTGEFDEPLWITSDFN